MYLKKRAVARVIQDLIFQIRATGSFHDVGTITTASGKRRNDVLAGFGTPTLKGIWETAPYLHDGSAPTLYDVLITKNQENEHGDLTTLSESEINQLIAFLLQIDESDDAIITGISNKASNTSSSAIRVLPNPAVEKIVIQLNKKSLRSETIVIRSLYWWKDNSYNPHCKPIRNNSGCAKLCAWCVLCILFK